MRLAEVCLVDTVDFGKLDFLLLESSSCLLIMGGKRLAVTTPVPGFRQRDMRMNITCHGAKNSTRIRGSGSTVEAKLSFVRFNTSEVLAPSAASLAEARDTKATAEATDTKEVKRIGGGCARG